jgi:hypothetical protein
LKLRLLLRTSARKALKAVYRQCIRAVRPTGLGHFAREIVDVAGLVTTHDEARIGVRRLELSEPPRSPIVVPQSDPLPPLSEVQTTLSILDITSPGFSFRNGYLVDPERRVVYEKKVLPAFDSLEVGLSPLERPQRVHGSVAWLWNAANYGHWLLLALPLLQYYRSYLGADADYYYAGAPLRAYQLESLEMLGIPRDRVVSHGVQADRLLAAIPDRAGGYDADFLLFADRALRPVDRPRAGGRRLFVSRAGAKHRRLVNEAECASALEEEHGVELVSTDRMSLADEIDLFRGADLVVGAHGAGLSNVVFAPTGARLVELASASYWYPLFAEIAALKRQPHALLRGRDVRFQMGVPRDRRDFEIDARRLVDLVGAALAHPVG